MKLYVKKIKIGTVTDRNANTRAINHIKMTYSQVNALKRLVARKKGISAKKAQSKLHLRVCVRTILNYLKKLGYRKIRTKYCQIVSHKNKFERIIYCKFCLLTNELFELSIFLDECTVELCYESKEFWFRDEPGKIKLVGKYQHQATVHVLGAISRRGPSKLMIFTGKLNAIGFQMLCNEFLIPFVRDKYPLVHRIHMDNAAFHVNDSTKIYFNRNMLYHFKTPAQSPDLNPIELVWNDLKNYLANEYSPKNIEDLVNGIERFWETRVTIEYCNSKINHLSSVIPRIISLNGGPTGL